MTTTAESPGAAIIGAGLMGLWHARAAAKAGARIAVVIDSDRSAAAALSARFAGSRTAATIDGIGELGVRVAHVCTPVETHGATAEALLDAGIHVLVEKPLASSPAITAAVLAKAVVVGRLVCPVHQFAFQRGVRDAAEAIRNLGQLLHFDFAICSAGAPSEAARASLIESVLPHPLSLISVFLPLSVAGLQWKVLRPDPGELRAVSATGSATVSILLSTNGRPTASALTLICERGTISLDLFHGFCVIEAGNVSRFRKLSRPIVRSAATLSAAAGNLVWRAVRGQTAFPGLNELTARFYESVRTGGASPVSPADTLDIAVARQRILDAGTTS